MKPIPITTSAPSFVAAVPRDAPFPFDRALQPFVWELADAWQHTVMLFELEGTIVYVNAAAARRLGRTAEQLVGTSIWSTLPPDDVPHRKTVVHRVAATCQPIRFTEPHGDRWDAVLVQPVGAMVGRPLLIATMVWDITQQIRAEEQLKLATLQLLTIQEDERRRIAQDLHDDIGQSMTALILQLKSIHSGLAAGRADARDQVGQAIGSVEDMMRRLRQVFYELRPPSFAAAPLAKVLESFCSSLALSTGLRVFFSSQPSLPAIPDVQATVLYRLVQEGMNNVIKHAHATSVWINLEYLNGEINISLEDDGQGFNLNQGTSFAMGLQGIRERFFRLSGSLDVESARGQGTRLYGSLPIPVPPAG